MTEKVEKGFYLFRDGDGVFVVSNTPGVFSDEGIREALKRQIQKRGLEGIVNTDLEQKLARARFGEAVRIGTLPVDGSEDGNGWVDSRDGIVDDNPADDEQPYEADVIEDDMLVFLGIEDGVTSIDAESIRDFLKDKRIIHGIIDKNIATIVKNYPSLNRILVAAGTHPEHGKDAEIKLVKEIKTEPTPIIQPDGSVDFKKLNLISQVRAGEVLQVRKPPTDGVSGMDIYGRIIPARRGNDVKLSRGEKTYMSVDGLSLLASDEGFIFLDPDGSISIRAVYIVDGDVDYHTGHIEYKGDVIIKGDVRTGFDVLAGGDVHIRGTVENSMLKAERDIHINGGVRSSGGAVIMAGRDLHAGFVENARIDAGRNVIVQREILHSDIRSTGCVEVRRRKGRIVGGRTISGSWIVASTLGSASGSTLELAFEPDGWGRIFKELEKMDKYVREISDSHGLNSAERQNAMEEVREHRAAKIAFIGMLFDKCFATTQRIISPVSVRFGDIQRKISPVNKAATIRLENMKVEFENTYIDESQRNMIGRGTD
jgi:hypothetical protein